MIELKPCPFCGCHDYGVHLQRLYYENDNYTKHKVICEDCGAEEAAKKFWNRGVSND